MSQNIIPLIVLERGGKELARPIIDYFPFDKVEKIDTTVAVGNTIQIGGEVIRVAEHPFDLEALANQESTEPFIVARRDLAALGNLAVQATGTAITKFVTEFPDVVGTTKGAATLDAATVGKVRIILQNDANVDLLLFPAVGEFHEGVAVNLSIDFAFGTRIHLYCKVAGTWLLIADGA